MNPLTLQPLLRQPVRGICGVETPFTQLATRSTKILYFAGLQSHHVRSSQCERNRLFSTTRLAQSRVGSAPITIPKDVKLDIFDLPAVAVAGVARGTEMPKVGVEVQGPL
ncbi:hypothetical protein KEM54_004198, partial [Ascosphaera aggregata]